MAAEFPMVSVSSSNPVPSYFEMLPEEFVIGRTIYDDNGADYKVQNGGAGRKQWILRYGPISVAQAAILDAHVASTFYSPDDGSGIGFNFRDRDTAVFHANVHYAPGGYKTSHTKKHAQYREIHLEKRP